MPPAFLLSDSVQCHSTCWGRRREYALLPLGRGHSLKGRSRENTPFPSKTVFSLPTGAHLVPLPFHHEGFQMATFGAASGHLALLFRLMQVVDSRWVR
jgi:hypothetical protein